MCVAEKRGVGGFCGLCKVERDQYGSQVLFFIFIRYQARNPPDYLPTGARTCPPVVVLIQTISSFFFGSAVTLI